MALADIINRIESDAGHEARQIREAAEAEQAGIIAEATSKAKKQTAETVERARRRVETVAATVRANARLKARDLAVGRRRALIDDALARTEQALVELPDDEYARLIAREVFVVLRGGEVVLLGPEDADRLRPRLDAALATAAGGSAPAIRYSSEPAPFPRGVLLRGERTSAEVSPASLIESRRDELVAVATAELFGEESA